MKNKLPAASLSLAMIFAAVGAAVRADSTAEAAKEKPVAMKSVSCPPECGFTCKSHDEKELIQIVKQHAKSAHNKTLTDEEIKGFMKEETPAEPLKSKKN